MAALAPMLWTIGGSFAALGVSQIKDGIDRMTRPAPVVAVPPRGGGSAPTAQSPLPGLPPITGYVLLAGGAVVVILLARKAFKGAV